MSIRIVTTDTDSVLADLRAEAAALADTWAATTERIRARERHLAHVEVTAYDRFRGNDQVIHAWLADHPSDYATDRA